MSGTLHYPDIASFQAGVNFSTTYAVVAKATEGLSYANPYYNSFKAQAARENVFFCAYHFLHHGNAAAQCQHYFSVVGHGVPGMVDVEPTGGSLPTVEDAVEFLNECHTLGIAVYLTYLPHWYWSKVLGSPSLAPLANIHQRLATSDYTTYSDTGPGWQGYGGLEVATWQYADNIAYGGSPAVDFNAFKGSGSADLAQTVDEFKAFMGTGAWS